MAYFDSVKNRVLWQKELEGLKQERDRRISGAYRVENPSTTTKKENPARVRITLDQLEREAREEKKNSHELEGRTRNMEHERTKTVQKERSL